jgi:hypothetical protein
MKNDLFYKFYRKKAELKTNDYLRVLPVELKKDQTGNFPQNLLSPPTSKPTYGFNPVTVQTKKLRVSWALNPTSLVHALKSLSPPLHGSFPLKK